MTNDAFRYYMHDGTAAFSFELAGRLSDDAARELEQAWRTASAVARDQSLIVDLSYVTEVDLSGRNLLRRWFDQGAQLIAKSAHAKAIVASITDQRSESIAVAAQHRTWLPVRWIALWALMSCLVPSRAAAADLKSETLQIWEGYLQAAGARNQRHLLPGNAFLWSDEIPGQTARLREGEVVVSSVGSRVPMKIPAGLIHDWIGAVFIPDVTIKDVLLLVRDYRHYKDFYRPKVIDSSLTESGESRDRFSVLLVNKSMISKTALDSDFQSFYRRLDDRHWYATSEATRIQEVADFGAPSQHMLPENQGTGLIWRWYSVSRFEERDGGVYIELEAIALSRDIPASLHLVVAPIVRRVSRAALVTSLQQTQEAVRSSASPVTRSVGVAPCSNFVSCLVPTRPMGSFR